MDIVPNVPPPGGPACGCVKKIGALGGTAWPSAAAARLRNMARYLMDQFVGKMELCAGASVQMFRTVVPVCMMALT
jgi:hypothetical protein